MQNRELRLLRLPNRTRTLESTAVSEMVLRLHALVCDGAFEVDVKIMEEALAGVYQKGVMQLSKFYYCFSASSERW